MLSKLILDLQSWASKRGAHLCGLSSLAMGADLIFADVLAGLNIHLRVLLPQSPDDFFNPADFDGAEAAAEARARLTRSTVLPPEVVTDSADRDTRFVECGFAIASQVDVLIAVDILGKGGGRGGTAETCKLAEGLGKHLIRVMISPATGGVDVSRQGDVPVLEWAHPVQPLEPDAALLVRLMKRLDKHAAAHKGTFYRVALFAMGCHILATGAAAIPLIWQDFGHENSGSFVSLKLVMLTLGLVAVVLSHRLHLNRAWAEGRLWSEILRSVLALKGMPGSLKHLEALRLPTCQGQLAFMNLHHQLGAHGATPELEAARQEYLSSRINRQAAYYGGKQAAHAGRLRLLQNIFYSLSVFSIAIVLLKWAHVFEDWADCFVLLSILLPMVAASVISWISISDLDRNTVVYRDMEQELAHMRREIETAPTWATFYAAVVRVETLLLQETVEWHYRQTHNQGH